MNCPLPGVIVNTCDPPYAILPEVGVMVPLPEATAAVYANVLRVKVAVPFRSLEMVMEQRFPLTESQPLQPVKSEPWAAVADKVTTVPLAYEALQPFVLPVVQLIFVPETVPLPVPASVTDNVWPDKMV